MFAAASGHRTRGLALSLALVVATLGAWAVSQPSRSHGPMGFDVFSPIGALALATGMRTVRGLARAPAAYALAALLMLAAGGNLFFYPPIPDGAYFLLRYGHTAAGELSPASAAWHVIGFSGVAWSFALLIEGCPAAEGVARRRRGYPARAADRRRRGGARTVHRDAARRHQPLAARRLVAGRYGRRCGRGLALAA